MEIGSVEFTLEEVRQFLDEMQGHDCQLLADRLERASARLAEIGPRVRPGRSGGDEWSDHEVLAHIAGLSKFYGVMAHRIASGQMTEFDLLQPARLRDGAIHQLSEQEPEVLLQAILDDHKRTIKMLRTIDPASMRRTVSVNDGTTMTAEEVARLPLVSHLEMHVEQLERSLSR